MQEEKQFIWSSDRVERILHILQLTKTKNINALASYNEIFLGSSKVIATEILAFRFLENKFWSELGYEFLDSKFGYDWFWNFAHDHGNGGDSIIEDFLRYVNVEVVK